VQSVLGARRGFQVRKLTTQLGAVQQHEAEKKRPAGREMEADYRRICNLTKGLQRSSGRLLKSANCARFAIGMAGGPTD
jgi:hypothetical protein